MLNLRYTGRFLLISDPFVLHVTWIAHWPHDVVATLNQRLWR